MSAADRRPARREADFRAAIAPWLAEEEAAARLVSAALETDLGKVLASLEEQPVGFPARRLRRDQDVEAAALVDAERARRRRQSGVHR